MNICSKRKRLAYSFIYTCWFAILICFSSAYAYGNGTAAIYKVDKYDIEVQVDPILQRIGGSNSITLTVLQRTQVIDLSLYAQWKIARVEFQGRSLDYERKNQRLRLKFPYTLREQEKLTIKVIYGGIPQESTNPPWDGGFIWDKDPNDNPLISFSCGNETAAMWLPISIYPSALIDTVEISLIVPNSLQAISCGFFLQVSKLPGDFHQYDWVCHYPLKANQISFFIGNYQKYFFPEAKKYLFPIQAYLLPNRKGNLLHLSQIFDILSCFESILGPYPHQDGYFSIVEAPYSGKSFQHILAYGHSFMNNSWGFDQVLVHEMAYQWFLFSAPPSSPQDEWIAHAFATYMEVFFLEYQLDHEAADRYLVSFRDKIQNITPILRAKDQWQPHSIQADFYYKGAWILHTIRELVNDDRLWHKTIRKFLQTYKGNPVTTTDMISFFSQELEEELAPIFDEYLTYSQLPIFDYRFKDRGKKAAFQYRCIARTSGFQLPVSVYLNGEWHQLIATQEWQEFPTKGISSYEFSIDPASGLFHLSSDMPTSGK